jgi:hypothetical protein
MKKIVASVGLVTLSASALQTAIAQDVTAPDTSKPWSVSATLRGFYDDNPGTVPNNISVANRDSFGFEITPAAALAWTLQQTTINLGFLYSFKYYDTIPPGSTGHHDQVFTFNAGLSHQFNENLKLRVSDSFVIGQEPDLLRAGNTFATFQRIPGDNIRNYGSIALDAQVSPKLGLSAGYDNAFYDYANKGATVVGATFVDPILGPITIPAISPSFAGTLNRIEQRAHLEGLYLLGPETKGILGYQFTDVDYTGDEYIAGYPTIPSSLRKSDFRNARQHTFYVGAEHNFSPEFSVTGRAGGSYTDYYNDSDTSATWSPYVNLTLKYSYAPESYIQGGFSYDRSPTDVIAQLGAGAVTTDAESAVVFGSVNHRIMPRFYGSLMGQFQNSLYHGGAFDNKSEQFYLVGLNLEYRINQYFAADLGYNYDRLESHDVGRTFDRNRVYIGVTASY